MKPLRRAAARLRDAGSIPVLAALLVVAVSAPLAAGEHNPPSDSSDLGVAAEPRSEPDSWTPPPSNDSGGSIGDDSGGSVGGDSGGSVGDDSGGSSDDDSAREVTVLAQKDYSEGRSAQPRSDSGSRPSAPSSSGGNSGGSSGGNSGGSSGGSGSRTAQPRSGSSDDSHQQRPRTGSRDNWHGGGWYGGGYYGGGYYGGGYYGGYSPYHRYYYWGPYFGWGWWGGWWGDDYYGYYPGYNQPRYYRDRYDRTAGALDIDVSPGKTEVWIDGRYIGTADDFDGFPQYLWLDRGVYDLALYREGYKTIARQITIYGGTVISIDDRMQRGESVKPQDLVTKTHERRDERIRSEEERREEIARRERDGMEDWRDRARRRMEERDRYDRDRDGRDEDRDADTAPDSDGIGRLRVEILPSDSSVYLDGKFVGTGIDLERIRQGLRVEPGEHRIAVVRPGHKSEEQEFTVSPGQEVELEIELESME